MLACIACSKHELEEDQDASRAAAATNNPRPKEPVKSLTSQLKDMVLKFSGTTYRQCKGGSSSSFRCKSLRRHRSGGYQVDDEGNSEAGGQYSYLRAGGSSSSTPAWDFTSINNSQAISGKWIAAGVGIMRTEKDEQVVLEQDGGEPKEWMAQVEPGVHITFVSIPGGTGNDLKRIRFSREMFNKWQAQRWWGENYDRIMELYNVQKFNRQALPTPLRSEDGEQRESFYSRVGSTRESPVTPPLSSERVARSTYTYSHMPPPQMTCATSGKGVYLPSVPDPSEHILPYYLQPPASSSSGIKGEFTRTSSIDAASRTTTSSRDEASISISNASDLEMTEWVEQDEPGVYITFRELADGTRELRRVRFSRERFGEVHAKLWWEQNRERIQAQYL